MRYDKRTDDNHKDVVTDLRAALPDASIFDASGLGRGFPDLVVGWQRKNYLFEIKDPEKPQSKRSLTGHQKDFHIEWKGQVHIAHSAAEICAQIARLNSHPDTK